MVIRCPQPVALPPIPTTAKIHCLNYVAVGSHDVEEEMSVAKVENRLHIFTEMLKEGSLKFRWEAICRPPNGLCYIRLRNRTMIHPVSDGYMWDGIEEMETNFSDYMKGHSKNGGKDVPFENMTEKSRMVNTARYQLNGADKSELELVFYRLGSMLCPLRPATSLPPLEGRKFEQFHDAVRTPYENFVVNVVCRDAGVGNDTLSADDLEDQAKYRWSQLTAQEKRVFFNMTQTQLAKREEMRLKAEAKEKAEEIAAEAQKKTEEDAIKAYNRGSNNTGIQQPYPSKFGNPITASTIEYPMEVDLEDVVPISGIADERFKRNYYLFSEIFDGKKVTKKLKSSDPETKNQIRYLEEAEDQCEAEIEKMETDFSTKYGKRKSSQDMWMKDLKEVTKCKTKAALDAFVAARPNLQLPDITKDMLRSMPDYKTKRITASSAHKDAATATSSVRIAQL